MSNYFVKIISFFLVVILFCKCNRIYNNPYDPQTSSNSWMPSNIELIVDDSSSVRLIWEQEESRIDGFILTNNNYPNNGPITIGKDQTTYSDNSSFILQNCGFDFNYTLKAYAGENQSDEIYYSNCANTFVSTISVSNISSESAFFQGNVYSTNSVDEKGFCWSTSTNPTINSNKVNLGSGAGDYNNQTNNLQQNTTYYLRAFASTSNEVYYGREIEFSTLEIVLPVVTTGNVTNISSNTAECGGNVTNDGNSNQTTKGVCWSSSSNPTVNDYKTNDGNGTGTFSSSITNLSTSSTYYVRAYAQNEAGTVYGNEKSLTTLDRSPCGSAPTETLSFFNTHVYTISPSSGAAWQIGTGYSGFGLTLTSSCYGGYIEFPSNMANYGNVVMRFWTKSLNAGYPNRTPIVTVNGSPINTTIISGSSSYDWMQLETDVFLAGQNTLKIEFTQIGTYYSYYIDEIEYFCGI